MPRRALAAPLAFVLLALPAAAQQQGAPGTSTTHPRAVPGTEGVTAVPGTGQMTNSGKDRGATNDANNGQQSPRMPFSTGPLQGGGGPQGQHSATPGPRSDAGSPPGARIVLAQAQTQAPPPAPGNASPSVARVQEQLRGLYTRLHVTAAQQPQWDAFANTMQANTQHVEDLWTTRRRGEPASALDDMRGYARIAQAHAEDMQRLVAAFAPLYASLSPEQKAAADLAFRQAQGGRGGGPPL